MPSEQATAAAENIASWLRLEAHQFPSDGNVAEWAKIIDAAFSPVVEERDALLATVREYCSEDEVARGQGYGCFGSNYILEIRKRHGIE